MRSLETHTLNPIDGADLSEVLLAGIAAKAVGIDITETLEPPAKNGGFSFEGRAMAGGQDTPAVSVIGDRLPPLQSQREVFEELSDHEYLRNFMSTARLSEVTGCIMRPETWRNHKGYQRASIKAAAELGIRNSGGGEAHRLVHFIRHAITTGRRPTREELGQTVDHTCRNQACVIHTRAMSDEENNLLKNIAKKTEPTLTSGQLFNAEDMMDELPWLLETIALEEDEPTRVLSTPLGPFALRLACPETFLVYGQKVRCEVFDALRPPARKTYERPSRSRMKSVIKGQRSIFPKTKYVKKAPRPTMKAVYQHEMSLL